MFSEQQPAVAYTTLELPVHRLCQKTWPESGPPFDFRLQTADCVSLFQNFVWWFKISQRFWIFRLNHAYAIMLSVW